VTGCWVARVKHGFPLGKDSCFALVRFLVGQVPLQLIQHRFCFMDGLPLADTSTCVTAGASKPVSPITHAVRAAVRSARHSAGTLDRCPATGTALNQLLPRRVDRAPRTQPADTHQAGVFYGLLFTASSRTLSTVTPKVDDSCAKEKIVLFLIRSVFKICEIVVDLGREWQSVY